MTMPETDTIDRTELAARLAAADDEQRAMLLVRHAALADVELARALKELYDDTESNDPTLAARAAAALTALAGVTGDTEVQALAAWTVGMSALDHGWMEEGMVKLDSAEVLFRELDQPHTAAATQVSKLIALAKLGRYEEAIDCGVRARDVFLAHEDILAAG
jgi:hypothetical protein